MLARTACMYFAPTGVSLRLGTSVSDIKPMEIIVEDFGCFVSKKSERVQIKRHGKLESEHALMLVEQLTLVGRGISISTDLIEECAQRGIQINFLTSTGNPYAKITGPTLSATVVTRREQMFAYCDTRGRDFAEKIVLAKTKNQINLLKYLSKYRKQSDTAVFEAIQNAVAEMEAIRVTIANLEGGTVDEIRGQLLSIEGRISEIYWTTIRKLLPEELAFHGREHRGAKDAVNSCLNYGYGILYSRIWGAVLLAGLEPFAGFLHVDRPGKPSLVLDMVEEFRQPVVDRAIWGWLNRGGKPEIDDDGLTHVTRKELAVRIAERLEAQEHYCGKKKIVRNIIQEQCRRLAGFLRRNQTYEAFTTSW